MDQTTEALSLLEARAVAVEMEVSSEGAGAGMITRRAAAARSITRSVSTFTRALDVKRVAAFAAQLERLLPMLHRVHRGVRFVQGSMSATQV